VHRIFPWLIVFRFRIIWMIGSISGVIIFIPLIVTACRSSSGMVVVVIIIAAGSGFVQNLSTSLNALIASGSGSLSLDAQGLSSTSQSLSQTISDLQDAFNTKQQNLFLVYSRVNATLQELPLLQQQLSQQLASIP